jgi:signal transduction histidine kinase
VHVTVGLKPLIRLRSDVASVRRGTAKRIEGQFPTEVMPLVQETNELLDLQAHALKSARERASDLAHGLKTPLAVMAAKARQLQRLGEDAIAKDIEVQIDSMHRHVERELARARARGAVRSNLGNIDAAELLEALVSVIQGLPRGQTLRWTCEIPRKLDVAVDADDFNNMAGNLIENAQKWAQSHVRVTARKIEDAFELTIEDDGPGVAESDMARVQKRGERADENVSGSGLGLAIVSDLVETYRGRLELSRSALGGLKVVLTL